MGSCILYKRKKQKTSIKVLNFINNSNYIDNLVTAIICGLFSCSQFAHIFSKIIKKIEKFKELRNLYFLENSIIAMIFELFKKYKKSKKWLSQHCTLNHSDTSLYDINIISIKIKIIK